MIFILSKQLKRAFSVALALILAVGCLLTVDAATIDQIAKAALDYIIPQEGLYDTVLPNDNGALSIGRIGFHGTLALQIIQMIAKRNESQALSILGESLYNEVKSATYWDYRTLTTAETNAIRKLLQTNESKAVQDEQCLEYMRTYIRLAQSKGMTDPKAIVYFCDMHNQYGPSTPLSIAALAAQYAGSYAAITLDDYYNATIAKGYTYYRSRRDSCYKYCKSLTFGDAPVTGTLGDVDDDGKVTAKDARLALLASASLTSLTAEQKARADVNGDGSVTAKEARTILRVSARLESFPGSPAVEPPTNPGTTSYYTTTAEHGLRLRSGPGTDHNIVANQHIPYGTRISVSETSNGWGKTVYNGYTGWVSLEFCKKV